MLCPHKVLRALAHVMSRWCRALGRPQIGRGHFSLDAVVEAEIRTSSRPGSQSATCAASVNLRTSW